MAVIPLQLTIGAFSKPILSNNWAKVPTNIRDIHKMIFFIFFPPFPVKSSCNYMI